MNLSQFNLLPNNSKNNFMIFALAGHAKPVTIE